MLVITAKMFYGELNTITSKLENLRLNLVKFYTTTFVLAPYTKTSRTVSKFIKELKLNKKVLAIQRYTRLFLHYGGKKFNTFKGV